MLDKLLKLSKPELSTRRIKTSQVDKAPVCENAFQAAVFYEYITLENREPVVGVGSATGALWEHRSSSGRRVFLLCVWVWISLAFHMPLFYERHCVIDKGELKQLLNSKATDFRLGTNLPAV